MKTNSKRYQTFKNQIDNKNYTIDAGLKVLKGLTNNKFNETIEAHIKLNVDTKHSDQQLRTSIILPNGIGKQLKIAVFTEEENISEMLMAGAFNAGMDSLINNITSGNLNFDILLTTPILMPKLAKLGKILGPKGLMPSPKIGTVTTNLLDTLLEFKKGKMEYRTDKSGIVHVPFGKVNFNVEHLKQNIICLYDSILKNKPRGIKGKYINSFFICNTMSPSISIDLNSLKD